MELSKLGGCLVLSSAAPEVAVARARCPAQPSNAPSQCKSAERGCRREARPARVLVLRPRPGQ